MVEYRAIRHGEWDQAMALWTGVFGVGGWLFQTLSDSTAGRSLEHTRVAVEDGRIVSAVDVFIRDLRDASGQPVRVGGIGSVATYDDARRHGHSGRLLEQAIELMEREGCAWSFLFTGTHHHYERYGWARTPLTMRQGKVRTEFPVRDEEYRVALLTSDTWPLEAMAQIYEVFNATRPLSHVRNKTCWDIATRTRLEQSERKTLGAWSGGELVAYLSATLGQNEGSVDEACALPGHSGALTNLFVAAAEHAKSRGYSTMSFLLPSEPGIDGAMSQVCEGFEEHQRGHTMSRPIRGGFTMEQVKELFAAPGRQHYELDNF
ncbi:GNAT family N-acetyltransferase [Fimbriimonas ginsengisoli]|uniref:N-acetyltransferase domain-containing protein n=1 Tax=Fimbriimonas ginsengisoli Gsoil 348 TaxID=661478 RepID=A0A068NST8_FIMGI|nr:GNAT family N-acetyltransferase [Fimbriimonas ginsengisoli]AIE86573.1 hypothetical protein OP10G_3205 [Fimbriimonas ginsengisoli Gsoil 348]